MPIQLDVTSTIYAYEGTIKRIFKGCPKPDGWFGCFFTPTDSTNDLMIKGLVPKYQLHELREGNKFTVILQKTDENSNAYDIKSMNLIPSLKHLATILKNVKGVGVKTVDKLISEFGEDSLNVIKNEPDKLKDIGISSNKIELIKTAVSDGLNQMRIKILEIAPNLPIDVVDSMLSEAHCSRPHAFDDLLDSIKSHPYKLFVDYSNVTFRMSDEIALSLGFDPFCDERLSAAVYQVLQSDFRSFVYADLNTNRADIVKGVCTLLNRTNAGFMSSDYVDMKLTDILSGNHLDSSLMYVKDMLYERRKYVTEKSVAKRLAHMIPRNPIINVSDAEIEHQIDRFERMEGYKLDAYQREAVKVPFRGRVSSITGGPGRGKSSVSKCIIFVWEHLSPRHQQVILCAPTGKACNRLSEATDRTNVSTAARLICLHEYCLDHPNTKSAKLHLSEWRDNLVIIDESSMIGLDTANHLLEIFENSHILFMGDTEQLPSIEYGQFFKDICDCPDIETARLVINHRSTGAIIAAADMINQGVHIEYTPLTNDDTFTFYNTPDAVQSSRWIADKYASLVQDADFDKMRKNMANVCILTPMTKHEDGSSGLNMVLQNVLNPKGAPIEALDYYARGLNMHVVPRVHDRIIFTKNDPEVEFVRVTDFSSGFGISNGDCGIIESHYFSGTDEFVVLLMDDGRRYDLDIMTCLDSVELAYAMSIHKSQGSEYDTVIVSSQPALMFTPEGFATRNLMYTAITRAKTHCIMFGSLEAMNKCIDAKLKPRNSQLLTLIDSMLGSN